MIPEFIKKLWYNKPNVTTPIKAEELNRIEDALDEVVNTHARGDGSDHSQVSTNTQNIYTNLNYIHDLQEVAHDPASAGSGIDVTGQVISNIDKGSDAVATHELSYDHTKIHDPVTAGSGIDVTGQEVSNTDPGSAAVSTHESNFYHPSSDEKDALNNSNLPSSTNPFATLNDIPDPELTSDQLAAIQGANLPSANNVLATMSDVKGTIIASTYYDLFDPIVGLATLGQLVPGQEYSWEYSADYIIPNSNPPSGGQGDLETLIGIAISPSKIDVSVRSVQHPNDIIYYNPNNDIYIDGASEHGTILWREDPIRLIKCDFDWRGLVVRCYKETADSTVYARPINNGFGYQDFPVFADIEDYHTDYQPDKRGLASITILKHRKDNEGTHEWPAICFQNGAYKVRMENGNNHGIFTDYVVNFYNKFCTPFYVEGWLSGVFAYGGAPYYFKGGMRDCILFRSFDNLEGNFQNCMFLPGNYTIDPGDYTDTIFGLNESVDHELISNLLGGDNGEHYHILSDHWDAITNSNVPSSTNPFQTVTDDTLAGITNTSGSTISFENSTRTFSITPVLDGLYVWLGKQRIHKSSICSVVIENTVGLHYIYFDSSDGILKSNTSSWDIVEVNAPIATVYWDGSTGWIGDERHPQRDTAGRAIHEMMHKTIGTRYASGLAGTFTNTTLSLTSGIIFDENLKISIDAKTVCRLLYRNVSNQMICTSNCSTPYKVSAGALQYDNAGTPASVDVSKYVVNDVYATNDVTYPIYVVVGQSQYNTLTLARNAAQATISNIPTREWKLLYRVIYQNSGGNPTYIESTDYRVSSSLPGGSITSLPASSVVVTPTGNISSTNTQAALEELDTEKLAIADIDDTPVNGEVAQPISSNWAYDHAAATATHGVSGAIVGTTDAQTISAKTLTNYKETLYSVTTSGNVTIDLANGPVQRFILDAARQFTMPADPGAVSTSFVLRINCAGFTPTWNTSPSLIWLTADNTAPPLNTTSGKINVLGFTWDDTLSRWEGYLIGKEI